METEKNVDEIIRSAFGHYESQEDKISAIFGGKEPEKKEEAPAVPDKKEEQQSEPEKKPDLNTYVTAEQIESQIENKMKDLIAPLQKDRTNRAINEKTTEINKLKLAYDEAIQDGETDKANELFERLYEAKNELSELHKLKEEPAAKKPLKLAERLTEEEVKFVSVMINNLRSEMFEGEEGKAREQKLAKIHSDLTELYPGGDEKTVQTRLTYMKEAFDKEWKMFEPNIAPTRSEPGDTSRETTTEKKITLDKIPARYVDLGREFKLSDDEIVKSYQADLKKNFGVK